MAQQYREKGGNLFGRALFTGTLVVLLTVSALVPAEASSSTTVTATEIVTGTTSLSSTTPTSQSVYLDGSGGYFTCTIGTTAPDCSGTPTPVEVHNGSWDGWTLTLSATDLTDGGSQSIPIDSVQVLSGILSGTGSTTGITQGSGYFRSGSMTLLAAAVGDGVGVFDESPQLYIPNSGITAATFNTALSYMFS